MLHYPYVPEGRKTEPGAPSFEKAPPEACALRPIRVKVHGLPVIEGAVQGTRPYVEEIARKHLRVYGSLGEWIEVEGERVE